MIHSASAPALGGSPSARSGASPRGTNSNQASARNFRRALHHLLANTPTRSLDVESSSSEDEDAGTLHAAAGPGAPRLAARPAASLELETIEKRNRIPDLGAKAARREPVEVDVMSSLRYGAATLRFIEKDGRRLLFADDVAAALDSPPLAQGDRRRSCLEASFLVRPGAGLGVAEAGRGREPVLVKAAVTDELGLFLLTLRSRLAWAREFYSWGCAFLRREEQAGHGKSENSAADIFAWLYRRDLDRQAEAAQKLARAQAAAPGPRRPRAGEEEGGGGGGEGEGEGEEGRPFSQLILQAAPPPPATKEDTRRLVEGRIVRAAAHALQQLRDLHVEKGGQWRLLGAHQNVMRHVRADAPRPPIYRASVTLPAPPHLVANFVWDTGRRAAWDALVHRVTVVSELDRLCKVERLEENRILPAHLPFDYCYVVSASYSAFERTYALAARSCEHPNVRPHPNYTRCNMLCVGYVVALVKKGVSQLTAYYQIEYRGVLNKVMEETLHAGRLQALITLRDSIRAEVVSGSAPRSLPFQRNAVGDVQSGLVRTKPGARSLVAVARLTKVLSKWKRTAAEKGEEGGGEGEAREGKELAFAIAPGQSDGERGAGPSLPPIPGAAGPGPGAGGAGSAASGSSRLQRQRSLRIETLIDAFEASAASPAPTDPPSRSPSARSPSARSPSARSPSARSPEPLRSISSLA
eukprot:tig00000383_g24681.t1